MEYKIDRSKKFRKEYNKLKIKGENKCKLYPDIVEAVKQQNY